MRGSFWAGLVASTVLAGSAMAAAPTKVEKLEGGGYLEVGSDSRTGDVVSFNHIELFDHDFHRDGKWVPDMVWRRSRVTLSCDWRMIISEDLVDMSAKDIPWPIFDTRTAGGRTFVPADGAMNQLYRRYCGDYTDRGEAVAFDKVMARARALLPPPYPGSAEPAKLQPRPPAASGSQAILVTKPWTPVPDQHFWDFGPASWRKLEGLPADRATVFVNAARIAVLGETRSAWVFMVPPPFDPEEPDVPRDAAMRQYKIDCETGEVDLVGQTVWWATLGTYPESRRGGSEGQALAGSLTGQLKMAVCTSKFSEKAWPSMDEAYKSVVGRSRWVW